MNKKELEKLDKIVLIEIMKLAEKVTELETQ